MAAKRRSPSSSDAAATAGSAEGDPVGLLLALGLSFRSIEAAIGGSKPWLAPDLTTTQLNAVMSIAHTGGMPSSSLATHLGIARSAVTALVDRLIAQKLVRREADARDRRVIWIRPTSRALALQQTLLQTRRPVLERVWNEVPASKREAVHRALELLLDSAEQVLQKAQTTSD